MTPNDPRNMATFVAECLELLGTDACASGADVGIAYRAWINDPGIADDAVIEALDAALPPETLRVLAFGGSRWVQGAQLSPIGEDMVQEGVVMHLDASAA